MGDGYSQCTKHNGNGSNTLHAGINNQFKTNTYIRYHNGQRAFKTHDVNIDKRGGGKNYGMLYRNNNVTISNNKNMNEKTPDRQTDSNFCHYLLMNNETVFIDNQMNQTILNNNQMNESHTQTINVQIGNRPQNFKRNFGIDSKHNYTNLMQCDIIYECENKNYDRFKHLMIENRKFLKIIHFNAQGLLEGSHYDNISNYVKDDIVDIIAIGETWLHKNIPNKMIAIGQYQVFRSDRNTRKSVIKRCGGGVCVYVRRGLKITRIEKSNGNDFSSIDFIILEIQSSSTKLLFACIYRLGECPDNETDGVMHRINELSTEFEHSLVCGDLNANAFDKNKYAKLHVLTANLKRINDSCATYVVGDFNPSQLDLFFTGNEHSVKCFGHFPAIGISNHAAIYTILNTFTTKKKLNTFTIRNINDIDDLLVAQTAEAINWSAIHNSNEVNGQTELLYHIIYKFMDEICPEKQIISKNNPVPWMNNEIRELMIKRKQFYDWWTLNRKHPSGQIVYNSYAKISNQVNYMIRDQKRGLLKSGLDEAKDPKSRWNLIHNFGITKKSQKIEKFNIQSHNFDADSLNDEFLKLSPLKPTILNLMPPTVTFNFHEVTPGYVLHTIKSIKSNGTGLDKIPPKFIKTIAEYVSAPFAHIINTSFRTGVFPNKLKQTSITPIPKVGNPTSPAQFRPISSANFLLKVFSKITCEQLMNHLENNKLLDDRQSGFRRGRGCTTAILHLTEDIHMSISNGKCVVLVLLDFSNAFGSVDHSILLQTLRAVGVTGSSMKWYKNFLSDWQQVVKYDDKISKARTIKRGIIQGENNSQLLFSIFINNIIQYLKFSKVILYADDVQLYIETGLANIGDAIDILNSEMHNVEQFCNDFGMSINSSKSEAIIISSKNNLFQIKYENLPPIKINNQVIKYVDEVRDLGYYMNRTLTNDTHLRLLQQKVYGGLSKIRPLRKIMHEDTRLQLVKTLILPIFDYMDVIYHAYGTYGSGGDENKLEKLFNTCIRYILNLPRHEHITPYRNDLKLLTMYERRTSHVASMIFKILNGETPQYLNNIININSHNTRSKNKLIIKKPNNNFQKNSLFIGGPNLWNKIPEEIRNSVTSDNFKKNYELYISNRRENQNN